MLAGLTHLRALAIALVFVFHYRSFAHPAWVDRVGDFGWTGVDLFFVLSGFLISRQLLGEIARTGQSSLRRFYFKRALRILPAYLVVVAAYACFPSIHEREALPSLWRLVTFTQNLGLDVSVTGTFSHAWSLCIEEQFYLLLPLVLWGFAPRRAAWLLPLLCVGGLVTRALLYRYRLAGLAPDDFEVAWHRWIYYPTWSRLDGLLVGIALAALRPPKRGRVWLVVAVIGWALAAYVFSDPSSLVGSIIAFPIIAAVYGALVQAARDPASVLARCSQITGWLAAVSYSLYLTHKASVHVAQRELGRLGLAPDGSVMFVCCVAFALLVASVLHVLVERPLLGWRDRMLR